MLLIAVATIAGVLLDSYAARRCIRPRFATVTVYGWLISGFDLSGAAHPSNGPSIRRIVAVLIFVPFGGYLHNSQSHLHHNRTILQYLCSTEQPTIIHGIVDLRTDAT